MFDFMLDQKVRFALDGRVSMAALEANLISQSGREETASAQYERSQSMWKTLL
jgi:hypothetical protein